MIPMWEKITARVIFIQGAKDNLVDPGNAAFAKKQMINTSVDIIYKEDLNHFIPWNRPALVRAAVLDMVLHTKIASVSTPESEK